jgi:hypothetical protein
MPASDLRLLLTLHPGPDTDAAETAELARRLRREILDLDVEQAEFQPSQDTAAGAKGAGLDWTHLLLTLSNPGGALTSVIAAVQSWLGRGGDQHRSVTVEIGGDKLTVTGMTSEDQKRVITAWLKRQQPR